MLTAHIDRYVALRQAFGYRLRKTARRLHAFARFADAKGDNTHIRTSTAVAWATDAPSPGARHIRLRDVVHLARFLHAEDAAHEVPPATLFPAPKIRPCLTFTRPRRWRRSLRLPADFDGHTHSGARCMRHSSD
jgi:hypothetical protein